MQMALPDPVASATTIALPTFAALLESLPEGSADYFRALQLSDTQDIVLRLPGGARVLDSLRWDYDVSGMQRKSGRVSALWVDGDLEIEGDLLNLDASAGPSLIVTGDLRVRHLVHGGASWVIVGNVHATGVMLGHDNDGVLIVEGDVHASLFASQGHHAEVRGSLYAPSLDEQDNILRLRPELIDHEFEELQLDEQALIACILRAEWPLASAASSILHAASAGELATVQQLIGQGIDLQQSDGRGMTALMIAARRGHAAVVTELLAAGAMLDRCDRQGWTALHHASAEDHAQTLAALLSAGAKVDLLDNQKRSSLWLAVEAHAAAAVGALLAAGAKPNLLPRRGESVLLRWLLAVWRGSMVGDDALLQAFLDAGASTQVKNKEGMTAQLAALAFAGPVNLTRMTPRGPLLHTIRCGPVELNALHIAAMHGHAPALDWLDSQAFPVAEHIQREAGWLLALAIGGQAQLRTLLDGDADLAAFSADPPSPHRIDAICWLLRHGASPNTEFRGLELALLSSEPLLLGRLLDAGLDPNHHDASGQSLLCRVVSDAPPSSDVALAALLLERGANPFAHLGDTGRPLIDWVAAGGDLDLLSAFLAAAPIRETASAEQCRLWVEQAEYARERVRLMQLQQHSLRYLASADAQTLVDAGQFRVSPRMDIDSAASDIAELRAAHLAMLERWPALAGALQELHLEHQQERAVERQRLDRLFASAAPPKA